MNGQQIVHALLNYLAANDRDSAINTADALIEWLGRPSNPVPNPKGPDGVLLHAEVRGYKLLQGALRKLLSAASADDLEDIRNSITNDGR